MHLTVLLEQATRDPQSQVATTDDQDSATIHRAATLPLQRQLLSISFCAAALRFSNSPSSMRE